MATSSVAAFMGVSLLLAVTPGADWAYVIATVLRRGPAAPAIGGVLVGHAGHCLAVMAGMAGIVAAKPGVLSALTVAGAAYLVWLGAVTAHGPASVEAASDAPARSARRTFIAGAGASGLNPKVLLLFLALLPQFSDRSGALSLPLQIGVLGATHILICAVVYTAVATLARTILRTRPGIARGVSRASGLAMMAIGMALFVERLHS